MKPAHSFIAVGHSPLRHAVEQAHTDLERFDLTTNTLVQVNVAFYERRGYEVIS